MKNGKVMLTLAAVSLTMAGVYYLRPTSAQPYWWNNETELLAPNLWSVEGYNCSYGYSHRYNNYEDCLFWNQTGDGERLRRNNPPCQGPDWEPEDGNPGWGPYKHCQTEGLSYRSQVRNQSSRGGWGNSNGRMMRGQCGG